MSERWGTDRVLALAPDAASVSAARTLALASGWHDTGCTEAAVWGAVAGSGNNPYRVMVDLTGPAYRCSCPSRKIPCKHALGLLLVWAEGRVDEVDTAQLSDAVTEWLDSRGERAERAAERAERKAGPPDPVAQAKRVEQRAERVASGVAELDRWLADQLRTGLVPLRNRGYAAFDALAARMVDAQAPGLASRVRGLSAVLASGSEWTSRLLEELALLRLLVRGHQQLATFDRTDPALAATVRVHVGYPVPKDGVLAGRPLRDTWTVWHRRDTELDNLTQHTAYLQAGSGAHAVVLSFAPQGGYLDESLTPGLSFQADLHFYPGAWPSRALIGERGELVPAGPPVTVSVRRARDLVAEALTADPWVRAVPLWVWGVPVQHGDGWALADDAGDAVPLAGADPWVMLAACGGRPGPHLLEWTPTGWLALASHDDETGPVALTPNAAAGSSGSVSPGSASPGPSHTGSASPGSASQWSGGATWDDLLAASIQGAARRAGNRATWLAELGEPAATLTADPADAVLDAAALATVARRAGAPALFALPEDDPAPVDVRPVIPAEALSLADGHPAALSGLLERSAELGLRLPASRVPWLLEHPGLGLAAPVGKAVAGATGRWLASRNPAWAPRYADDLLAETDDPYDDRPWREGTPDQRLHWLARLRRLDRPAAQQLIEQALAPRGEPAEMKARILHLISADPQLLDEPVLELALDARAERVRHVAQTALKQLPGSAYVNRMRVRAAEWVQLDWVQLGVGRGALAFALSVPGQLDPAAQRDGVAEPRKLLVTAGRPAHLYQVVTSLPLTYWQSSGTPEQLIAAALQTEVTHALLTAWSHRAIAEHDVAWADALLGVPDDIFRREIGALAHVASDEARHETSRRFLDELLAAGGPTVAAQRWFADVDFPLPSDLCAQLVEALPALSATRRGRDTATDLIGRLSRAQPPDDWVPTLTDVVILLPPLVARTAEQALTLHALQSRVDQLLTDALEQHQVSHQVSRHREREGAYAAHDPPQDDPDDPAVHPQPDQELS